MADGEVRVPRPEAIPGAVTVEACRRERREVVDELVTVLAREPSVVLCDLTGLRGTGGLLVTDLAPVAHYLDHWPGCVVMLYAPGERVRSALAGAGLGGGVLVSGSWVAGVSEAIARRPFVDRAQLLLVPTHGAAGAVRSFVARVLRQWQLAHLVDPTVLAADELVGGSLAEAHSVLTLSVSRTGTRVRVAVGDRGRTTDPRVCERAQDAVRGWGVLPGRHGRRTVWVVLDATSRPR